jgi:UDP-N-acetylglucosamine--N-acetylmuramyl-(pentapeptide) pyrophosphoryl-undecaprenol N-acetylglucosamine transferase
MAGGGTGGHVIPLLAVARLLRDRGHFPFFVGTRTGMEARLVPEAGFPIEWIEIGGLKRVGLATTFRTLWQLPASVASVAALIKKQKPAAVFSLGGFAAGPVMLAAVLRGVPIVAMEPNAMPGVTNRWLGRFVARALVSFEETLRYFPPGRAEVSGVPVRKEFFAIEPRSAAATFNVLITGGSQGSQTLNRAAEQSWPLLANTNIRLLHQTGANAFQEITDRFAKSGVAGDVVPFIKDMPAAFASADLIVSRSGAGACAELAAAGKPAILVPFPFAADDHQKKNAEAFERAGAARMILDRDLTGERLCQELSRLAADRDSLAAMSRAAKSLAKPGAAERAVEVLEQIGARA